MSKSRSVKDNEYYIGLDCGTSSVGWAVTDSDYNLLRAKGKTLWGSRLFDEANTAADRRVNRSSRRRLDRKQERIKLLRLLFRDEMIKVDPDFYLRLDESFYCAEDKKAGSDGIQLSANTLFNDENFRDKDFHKKFPTIWHLRKYIIDNVDSDEKIDLRLYLLVIQHIFKHRGHFLREGKLDGSAGDFADVFNPFCDAIEKVGFSPMRNNLAAVRDTLCDKSMKKTDKKKKLQKELIDSVSVDGEDVSKQAVDLAGLIVGSRIDLTKLFNNEADDPFKLSFDDGNFEDRVTEIENVLDNSEYVDVVISAKQLHDYMVLDKLLGNAKTISEAMVRNYDLHKSDLRKIKSLLMPYREDYDRLFKSTEPGVNYNTYIGNAYTVDKSGRHKPAKSGVATQESLAKEIADTFKRHDIDISNDKDFSLRLENGELLPKQRGQAKGTIPQQLHHNELEIICGKLAKDYPSFNTDIDGQSKIDKLLRIHDFRRPYYCGPLVSKNKSEFSWVNEEINEKVYPWNFERLVKLDDRAEGFISRMTNECTYLVGEDVLPKASPLYQKYMVLNEINNIKINGQRINDHSLKRKIYEQGFVSGELTGNVTLRKFESWLKNVCLIDKDDEVGGASEAKYLPKLSTHQDLKRILSDNYNHEYDGNKIEEVVRAITILNNDRSMLARKIGKILDLPESDDRVIKLSKLSYKDWGKFSKKFLDGIRSQVGVREMSIIEALEESENNLMELLGGNHNYHFKEAIDDFNKPKQSTSKGVSYNDVDELYCSPAVKRSVWQAVKIVKELVGVAGHAPAKIFLESTREDTPETKKKMTASRKKQLLETYRAITNSNEAKELLDTLDKTDDTALRQKKLYLYYCQMGRCAYSGERIDLDDLNNINLYDIDHIYPRSLTKDDSITRNLVLVKANLNREKTNVYPINEQIRQKMKGQWLQWRRAGLITKDKYERLTRATRLTDEELAGFIQRQIVETSQTVKAIRDLFNRQYPDSKIVLVKAGQVSDLRHFYGYEHTDRETGEVLEGRPEFIKIRALNDLHHAKDAYLNIVVGNTMNMTFTDDPYKWLVARNEGDDHKYSIKTELLFRPSEVYKSSKTGNLVDWPRMKGWKYRESLDVVSKSLKRNDVLWTRMVHPQTGQLFDLQPIGKMPDDSQSDTQDAVVSLRSDDKRLARTARYGGYNSTRGAYFAVIEVNDSKKGLRRKLVQVPITSTNSPCEYLTQTYNSRVILQRVDFFSLLQKDGCRLLLTGRTGSSISVYPGIQLYLSGASSTTLKRVLAVSKKVKEAKRNKNEYTVSDKDNLTSMAVKELFTELSNKLLINFINVPGFGGRVKEIADASNKFLSLDIGDQCCVMQTLIEIAGCNATRGDLGLIIPRAAQVGLCTFSNDITDYSIKLIHQSVTGLFEHEIDLNTYEPKQ